MVEHFGLDIGSTTIKAVDLSGGKAVAGAAWNPAGHVGLDLVPSEKLAVADTVKRLIKSLGINKSKVMMSMPEQLVFSRILEMPMMSDPELGTAIKWELDQISPYPVVDMEYSWVVLDKNREGSGKIWSFVVAVPKKTSKEYLEFADSMDLELVRLENEAFSLIRSVIESGKVVGDSLIVDWGASSTKIILAGPGRIGGVHVVPIGGITLTKVLAETFGIAFDQAEQYKLNYGIDRNAVEGKIYQAMLPMVEQVIVELKRAILSFNSVGGSNSKLNKLFLVGGGSLTKGLPALLAERIGLEVMLPDPFEKVKLIGNNPLVSIYAGAMGLAIG